MFGGRTSPVSCTNSLRMIEIFKRGGENFNFTQRTVQPNSNVKPEPRWRHSSSIVDHQIIVVGGRNSLTVFNDIWSFDINSLIWSKFENESDHFKPRHSHSAVLWENNPTRSVIISGGLGKDMNPLNDVFMLQFCERSQLLSLRGLDIQPNLLPRYSHTSHIMGNILLLVGGVQFSHRSCDDIAVINLATKTWYKRISLPCSVDNSPIRLLGHVSCLTKKTSECVLTFFGGGSNCFSFGTSFNKSPFKCSCFELKYTMAVHTESAVFFVLFNHKCVTEKVPNEIEWNGKQKELSTSLIRNSQLTD
uniref:Uncharacterized protein n=1 Tax=Ciona savignyi TaxID=51511 RepID=H2ZAB0_CIOSA